MLLEEIGSTSLPTMIFEICALDVADKKLVIFLVQEFSAGSIYIAMRAKSEKCSSVNVDRV